MEFDTKRPSSDYLLAFGTVEMGAWKLVDRFHTHRRASSVVPFGVVLPQFRPPERCKGPRPRVLSARAPAVLVAAPVVARTCSHQQRARASVSCRLLCSGLNAEGSSCIRFPGLHSS